jgi:hypothetical protein
LLTYGISRPLAATSVQTRIAESFPASPVVSIEFTPLLNLSRFLSLYFYYILEWRQQFLIFKKSNKHVNLLVAVIALQKITTLSPFFYCKK